MKNDLWTWEQSVIWLRQQPNQQSLVRACYYDDPLLAAAQRFTRSDEWRSLRTFLNNSVGLALDIGAGRGISSYALACDGWRVVALEPDPSLLVGAGAINQLVRETHLSIMVVEAFGEAMPFVESTFDLVYGREVLHHASDLPRLCMEAARLLKPGGWFLATRETVISRSEDLEIFLNNHPLHKYFGGENAFLLKDYVSAISKSGLEIKKILGPLDNPINFYPFDDEMHIGSFRMKLYFRIHRFLVHSLYRVRSTLAHTLPNAVTHRFFRALDAPGRLYSFVARKPVG